MPTDPTSTLHNGSAQLVHVLKFLNREDTLAASRISDKFFAAASDHESWDVKFESNEVLKACLTTKIPFDLVTPYQFEMVMKAAEVKFKDDKEEDETLHGIIKGALIDNALPTDQDRIDAKETKYYNAMTLVFETFSKRLHTHFPAGFILQRHPAIVDAPQEPACARGWVRYYKWQQVTKLMNRWYRQEIPSCEFVGEKGSQVPKVTRVIAREDTEPHYALWILATYRYGTRTKCPFHERLVEAGVSLLRNTKIKLSPELYSEVCQTTERIVANPTYTKGIKEAMARDNWKPHYGNELELPQYVLGVIDNMRTYQEGDAKYTTIYNESIVTIADTLSTTVDKLKEVCKKYQAVSDAAPYALPLLVPEELSFDIPGQGYVKHIVQ